MEEKTLSDKFFEREQEKLNQKYREKYLILLLGIFSLIGWSILIMQIIYAFFFDKSSILGFEDSYGIVIIAHNLFSEIIFEIILFIGIFSLTLILTIYLFRKVK